MPHRRGSSLIELLVVISIIALLFGMLIPSLKRSIKMASNAICMHNLRQIGQSLAMYRTDYDGWLPAVRTPPVDVVAGDREEVWFLRLYPTYLPDPLILTCPDDPYRYRMIRARDQMNRPGIGDLPSYGINSFIMTAGEGMLANVDRYPPSRPLDTILAADLGPDYGVHRSRGGQSLGPVRNSSLLTVDDGLDLFSGRGESWLTARHGDGINILTLAGGVRPARTIDVLRNRLDFHYENCAAGGCTLCRELKIYHYSFHQDRLYWWTGHAPDSVVNRFGN